VASAQSVSESGHLAASLMPGVRQRSEAVDVDHRQVFGRRLNRVAFVMVLHEFAPVGGWAAGRRAGRTLERFAEMRKNLPDRPWLGDERDQPDVAAAVWALKRKLLPHPRHQFCPCNPRRIVGAGLWGRVIRVAAASRGAPVARMPARRGIAMLADIPDRERRDGGPELVIGCKQPMIPMPMLARRRHEIRKPVQKPNRRETQPARARPCRWPLAAWTFARGPVRPSWRLYAWAARSGHGRCGRSRNE